MTSLCEQEVALAASRAALRRWAHLLRAQQSARRQLERVRMYKHARNRQCLRSVLLAWRHGPGATTLLISSHH